MKLDKIRFARLISYLTEQDLRHGNRLTEVQIASIDELVDFDMPQPEYKTPAKTFPANEADVNKLIALLHDGGEFKYRLEAIKLHRNLTGSGLKEAKDLIESYWKYPAKGPSADEIGDIIAHHTPKAIGAPADPNLNSTIHPKSNLDAENFGIRKVAPDLGTNPVGKAC